MASKIGLAAMLGVLLTTAALAQTFDGTYRGTRTITRTPAAGVAMPDCPGIGGMTTAIEFQVTGTTIALRYMHRTETVFNGTIGPEGTFNISTVWQLPGGARATVTWSGRIQGQRLQGVLVGLAQGGECRGTLTARKQS